MLGVWNSLSFRRDCISTASVSKLSCLCFHFINEGHDLAEDIIALKEILSLKETEHNLTLPDAFADVSKETLKKGNYANPDSPVVNERVCNLRYLDTAFPSKN